MIVFTVIGGWIEIRPGRFAQNEGQEILLLTEFNVMDSPIEQTHLVKCIRWLKKEIREQITLGVIGKNIVLGGSAQYKNIGFTEKAAQALDSNVIWKQSPTDRSIFIPIH